MWIDIQPDWEGERRTLLVRPALTVLPLALAFTGLMDARMSLVLVISALSLMLLALDVWAIRRRWHWISTVNYWAQLLFLLLSLAGTGGMGGPMAFLAYILLIADLLWTRDRRSERLVTIHLIGVAWLGSAFATWLGFDPQPATVLLHSMGLYFIAWFLVIPLRSLQLEASTDPLTGALNRRSGLNRLARWVENRTPFALIFLDLREFKQINDTHGHATGDAVLIELSRNLRTRLQRKDDTLIRYGGDEFLVAVPHGDQGTLENLMRTMPEHYTLNDKTLRVRCNLGMVRFPQDGSSLEALLQLADARMYEHKRHRNPTLLG
jgi:diguanylate cyclase (GGDEF)-like protein